VIGRGAVMIGTGDGGNIEAVVEVRTSSDGTITSRRIIKRSGNDAYDKAVLAALDKADKLPSDNGKYHNPLPIHFRPKD